MASRRSLGGGRVLGSGRNLSSAVSPAASPAASPAPAPPHTLQAPQPQHGHVRNVSLLSPSESSVSLSSQTSVSPASIAETGEDIGSKVLLGPSEHAAARASSRLACPICNEHMVTLLQLNRHLDDNHQNLVEEEQDEVKNWFEEQMVKAKKFQPLAVLNQKLKGLDVFESNSAPTPPPASHTRTAHDTPPAPIIRRDPEEEVTRAHWQRPGYRDVCSDPLCRRPITASGVALGNSQSAVNCRQCGQLFCEDHTLYQMKLSRAAKHEPVRGIWCRVCETCYKSREGYNDHHGLERNHFDEFAKIRRKRLDREHMEVSRLEKRLTKLTQLLADPPPAEGTPTAGRWFGLSTVGISTAKNQRKALEQSIITWEEDAKVSHCPFCQQEFSTYTFRRHHCRMCGRVVCGDPNTACSTEIGLNVNPNRSEKITDQMSVDVRMCKDCNHTLFSRSDFEREMAQRPKDQRAYENLAQFERGIRLLLPRFQKLLTALQDPERPPTPQQLTDATKVRKRLMDAFAQFDAAAKRIRDLPTESPTQKRLQQAVYQQAYSFLSLHMLPLRSLPKILKHAAPQGRPTGGGALAAIKASDKSGGSVVGSSEVSAMETEEKELRERLIVLEEQKFMVSEMVADATKHRRFDEHTTLAQNLDDLNQEIDHITGQLAQLDFASAYQRDENSPALR
ncbi:carboxypeptidase Y-deficient [Ascochyta rabiei]|uniref:Metal ion binding n=1 Tax=Didymella rabiei TaxID=5454 RepID=A0A162VW01_DIDRA|nr:carboxypeptidase Y-deficient [Ascochyta rabiei]KZM18638.1 metal ion binding [Ascochyta rabiei]UPX09981.1 carboxypeptidase Y-deficient [Ascochyta rabiei]